MLPKRQTALAWANLTHNPRRLATGLCGVGFAVLLMFMQTGFRYALFDSTVEVVRDLKADVIIVSRAKYALTSNCPFRQDRLHQARTVEGVAGAYPLYIEPYYSRWKSPGKKARPIRVLAWEPGDPLFHFPQPEEAADLLERDHTALIDLRSKPQYGLPEKEQLLALTGAELNDRRIQLVGTFCMGTDFANDGNLIMSAANFARYFPQRVPGGDPLSMVDVGVVQLTDGADATTVAQRLRRLLPNDVDVYPREEFVNREIAFWAQSTPIGYIFTVGTIMGFIVGVIICYQIIYSDIADHMAEFATLKAMGYRPQYFMSVVLCQSIYLSLLGFVPGVAVSQLMFWWLADTTGLMMSLTVGRAAMILVLTLAMCIISGCLAMRKVLATDPAELF